MAFTFTSDWISGRLGFWLPHTKHLIGTQCQLLEIGSWEGRSAVWMIKTYLSDPRAHLTCIDPWSSKELPRAEEREARFDHNINETGRAAQVTKCKGFSSEVLPTLFGPWDLVYVDGDHEARSALEDAVLCWRKLKPGGVLVFDDYLHTPKSVDVLPREGVDAFLLLWRHQLDILHRGWQVIVRKK